MLLPVADLLVVDSCLLLGGEPRAEKCHCRPRAPRVLLSFSSSASVMAKGASFSSRVNVAGIVV